MKQTTKAFALALAAICLCLCFCLCFCLMAAFATAQSERTYTIAHPVRDLPSIFASMAHGGPHWVTTTFLYDSLAWKDQNGVVPLLAESWQSSGDRKRWTFKLRPGVQWHDGQPLTVEDVKFTFDYLREHPGPFSATEANRQIEKVEVASPQTISFQLKSPSPDFLVSVAGSVLIIPKHIWQPVSDPLKYLDPPAFIGSGPFKYVETRRGEYHSFVANPNYFLGRPAIDRLVMKAVNNPPLALESGDIDATGVSSPRAIARFSGRDEFALVKGPYSYYLTKIVFNVSRPPFDKREVRQAVAYALNRAEIVKQTLEGNGIVSSAGLLHPDSEWFDHDLPRYEHDLKRAEEMLDKAGYSRRDADGARMSADGKRLEFTLYQRGESPEMARQAEMIRDQLDAAGIKLEIKPMNTGPMEALLAKSDFDIAFDSHGGAINLATPANNPDFPARTYRNDELKKLYAGFITELKVDKRRAVASHIQRIIAEDLPGIPIANPGSLLVYRKSKGVAWFWTKEGLGNGAPIWWNKLATLKADPTLAVASAPSSRSGALKAGGAVALAILLGAAALIAMRFRKRAAGR